MKKESIFGLGPEQLDRLLSIATDGKGSVKARGKPVRDPGGRGDDAGEMSAGGRHPSEANESARSPASLAALAEQPGGWIGHYRLLRALGEGGMGIVYLAEQAEPIKRQVALKVIKPGMDSKRVIARFEAERQALALLDHPNIAHVHDAGTTEAGHPYLVMEYVEGLPITDYCDQHKLAVKQRLKLFQQVCDAVQHAHQKGIIHRDLKPSNILVAADEDKAIPKIIDFGVAKALTQSLTDKTLYTEQGQFIGTPDYMSPEQADMATKDIDTRSDVYSLGVLLYVLLTGALPFDAKALRESGIEHIRKTIRETDPRTPTTRLMKLGDEAKKVAEMRRTQVAALAKRLRSELEWIPLKAMRKERSERYRSVAELADDIANYLSGDPLIAGPPGTLYRFSKFMRRNAIISAAVLAVVTTLILGLAGTTAMYIRAESLRMEAQEATVGQATARAEAEQALAEAQAVSDFLVNDILGEESFSNVEELDFDHVLDVTSEKLEGRFWDQPLVEARILDALGKRYLNVGRPELSRQHLERAYDIRLRHLGPEHSDMIGTVNMLCWAYKDLGRHDDALRVWNKQIQILQRTHGETYGWRMLFMHNIGDTYLSLGKHAEAELWFDEVLELCARSSSSRRHFVLFVTRWDQGQNYLSQGRYTDAEQILNQALEMRRGRADWRTLGCMTVLAQVYREQGRYEKAAPLLLDVYNKRQTNLGPEHAKTVGSLKQLISLYASWNKPEEAEKWRAKLPRLAGAEGQE